eukprot:1147354-Pelagomonas_calceolata.AAC.2
MQAFCKHKQGGLKKTLCSLTGGNFFEAYENSSVMAAATHRQTDFVSTVTWHDGRILYDFLLPKSTYS